MKRFFIFNPIPGKRMDELARFPDVLAAATAFAEQQAVLADLCVAVQQIAAPTDAEAVRAAWVQQQFAQLALHDVAVDDRANVYGRVAGATAQPALLVSAHTDTVFPHETDLTTRVEAESGHIYGPGIGDNSTGVAGLLTLGQVLQTLPPPPTDIWLVANSGEEGLGDLRGMRAAVDRLQDRVGACIVIEGMGLKRVVHRALGSHRFRVTAKAPGGHSWSDFGTASALHVLTQLAAELTQIKAPTQPRSTFNIGRMVGGTSVNTIAQEAWLELDLRSEDPAALRDLIEQTRRIVARYQGNGWRKQGITVALETIGDRPAGDIPDDHPLVQAAFRTLAACGVAPNTQLRISSTDANIPLSRGIPAVCIGITEGGNAHRLEEWINPKLLPVGMRYLLQLTWWSSLWLAGEVEQ
jgi:acetylornithine deacetylase/succinyl-diaminopimelate desuccinylase-like protein